jgi:hypothetical protein
MPSTPVHPVLLLLPSCPQFSYQAASVCLPVELKCDDLSYAPGLAADVTSSSTNILGTARQGSLGAARWVLVLNCVRPVTGNPCFCITFALYSLPVGSSIGSFISRLIITLGLIAFTKVIIC